MVQHARGMLRRLLFLISAPTGAGRVLAAAALGAAVTILAVLFGWAGGGAPGGRVVEKVPLPMALPPSDAPPASPPSGGGPVFPSAPAAGSGNGGIPAAPSGPVGAAATRAQIDQFVAGAGSRRRAILAFSERLQDFIAADLDKGVPADGIPTGVDLAAEKYDSLKLLVPAQVLIAFRDGRPVEAYPTTIGLPHEPTPVGTFTVINRVEDPTWYPPDGSPPVPPGPDNPIGHRWIGIDVPGYGLHGTNEPESIGTSTSLGCIRLFPDDVEHLFQRVSPGTPVEFVYERIWLLPGAASRDGAVSAVLGLFPDPYDRSELTFSDVAEALLALDFPVALEKQAVGEWISRAGDGPVLIVFHRPPPA